MPKIKLIKVCHEVVHVDCYECGSEVTKHLSTEPSTNWEEVSPEDLKFLVEHRTRLCKTEANEELLIIVHQEPLDSIMKDLKTKLKEEQQKYSQEQQEQEKKKTLRLEKAQALSRERKIKQLEKLQKELEDS